MVLSTAIVTALSVFGAFRHPGVIVIASVIVIFCIGVHTLPGFIVVVVVVVGVVVVVVRGSVVVVVGTVVVVTAVVVVGGSWGW